MTVFYKLYPQEFNAYMYMKYDIVGDMTQAEIDAIDGDLLQSAIEHKREIYREHYSASNAEVIDGLYSGSEVQFVSAYAPMVIVETDSTAAVAAARNAGVLSIDLLETETVTNEVDSVSSTSAHDYAALMDGIDLANEISRADVVRDDIGLTGAGVKIGVLEARGVPDVDNIYLDSATIHLKSSSAPVHEHATAVAAIIVAEDANGNPHGVAPDAELYCCHFEGDFSKIFEPTEWLLDSGVNIINASIESYSNPGAYSTLSAWFDHLAMQHDVHFVAAAGNYEELMREDKYIASPGSAYNAITVGYFDAHGENNLQGFEIDVASSYVESGQSGRTEKPNLVACGVFNDVEGPGNPLEGTSFAAPQVTGVVAQLCEYADRLKVKQATVSAVLMASAAKKLDAVGTGEKGDSFISNVRVDGMPQISDVEGAGILDARWAWGILVQNHYWRATVPADGFPYTQTVTVDAETNTVTRVAITWLKRNFVTTHTAGTINASSESLATLTLRVYDPDGNSVGYCSLGNGNFAIVQFVPEVTGTYTIEIDNIYDTLTTVGIALW